MRYEEVLFVVAVVCELLDSIGMILGFVSDSFFFLLHSLIFLVCGKLQEN